MIIFFDLFSLPRANEPKPSHDLSSDEYFFDKNIFMKLTGNVKIINFEEEKKIVLAMETLGRRVYGKHLNLW